MGADTWIQWADYEPDIDTVLQKTRQKVFAGGDYYLSSKPDMQWLGTPIDPDNPWDPDAPPDYMEYLRQIRDMGDRPSTIEDLIQWNGPSGDGTRSILDIETVGDQLRWHATTCPVPDHLLIEWLGTPKPTREQIERELSRLSHLTARGTAVHVVVYENEKPARVLFVGSRID